MTGSAEYQERLKHLSDVITPSIPAQFVSDMLEGFCLRGGDINAVLAPHGLSLEIITTAGYRVSIRQYVEILDLVSREMDDAALGFLNVKLPLRSFPVFCLGLSGARNFSESIDFFNKFYQMLNSGLAITQRFDGDLIVLGFECESPRKIDNRFSLQSLMRSCLGLLAWQLGEFVKPSLVRFSFPVRSYENHLAYLFGENIEYSCERNEMLLPASYMQLPVSVNMAMAQQMLRENKYLHLLQRDMNPYSLSVREALVLSQQHQWPDIEQVAAKMAMSSNLLWRKLKKEDTTFIKIREEVKRDWALQLLQQQSLSVEEVAEQLRFSDVSAFRKAFKKWTGATVSEYRSRAGKLL